MLRYTADRIAKNLAADQEKWNEAFVTATKKERAAYMTGYNAACIAILAELEKKGVIDAEEKRELSLHEKIELSHKRSNRV